MIFNSLKSGIPVFFLTVLCVSCTKPQERSVPETVSFSVEKLGEILPGTWEDIESTQVYFGEPGEEVEFHFRDAKTCFGISKIIGTYDIISSDKILFVLKEVEMMGGYTGYGDEPVILTFNTTSANQMLVEIESCNKQLYYAPLNKISGSSGFAGKQDSALQEALREPIPAATDDASKKIIAKHLAFRGGEGRLRNLRGVHLSGKFKEGRDEYKVLCWESPADKIRLEQIYRNLGREERVIYGFDGEQGWVHDQRKKDPSPVNKKPEDIPRILRQTTFHSPFIDPEAQGLIFQYEGKVNSRGRSNHLLKMYQPNGLAEHFYFDANTFLITRHSRKEVVKGFVVEKDELFSKYTKVSNIWLPEKVEFAAAKQVYGQFIIDRHVLNPTTAADLYSMPR